MNELDWWIASQWEMFKIKEGKTGLEFNKTDKEGNVLTVDRTQKWNKLRAKTDLKEMYIVRYADDFKLFCRDYATAKKVMCATKLWLAENLHLQTSGEKSGITNLRKNYTTFLGIKFKVVPKGSKWVIRSHMADKSKARSKEVIGCRGRNQAYYGRRSACLQRSHQNGSGTQGDCAFHEGEAETFGECQKI